MKRIVYALVLLVSAVLLTAACSGISPQLDTMMSQSQTDPNQHPAAKPNTAQEANVSSLPNYGPAPELSNTVWLNTDQPLRLADLRGKVVMVEMWTFDCINCIHVIPYVRSWYEKYKDQGFVVIGNHYPEFSYEHDLDNLKAAVVRLDVPYPVAQDNDGVTWNAYNNHYWPAMYLIDKHGDIRYKTIGEGAYDRTEQAIVDLLAETYS